MCPCQLLHIFPTYFNNFTNFVHLPDPRGPPQDLQGPPQDPLGPPRTLSDQGTETYFPKTKERVAHRAGTEPEFVNDVDGMRVAH